MERRRLKSGRYEKRSATLKLKGSRLWLHNDIPEEEYRRVLQGLIELPDWEELVGI